MPGRKDKKEDENRIIQLYLQAKASGDKKLQTFYENMLIKLKIKVPKL